MLILFYLTQFALASSPATSLAWLPEALTASTPQLSCEESSTQNLSQRCAQDMCGLPGTNPSIFVNPGSLEGFTPSPQTLQEVARVEADIDRATQAWQQQAEEFLTETARKLQDQVIDPKQISGVRRFFAPYLSYHVEGERIRIKTQFPEGTSAVLQAGVREWASHEEALAQQDPLLRLRLGLDSMDQVLEVMRARALQIAQSAQLPKFSSLMPQEQLIQLRQSLSQVEQLLSKPMPPVELLDSVDSFLAGLEDGFELTPRRQLGRQYGAFDDDSSQADPSCKAKCLEALAKEFTRDSIAQKITLIRKRLQSERGELISACRSGILLQAKMGDLPDQRQRALGLVEAALTKIENCGVLSPQTGANFGRMIRERTDIEPSFPSALLTGRDFMNAYSETAALRLTPSIFGRVEDDVNVLLDLSQVSGNLYGRDFRGCPSPRHLATDFFWPGIQKPLIHVSPHSCAHPTTGLAVVAHELGHALAHFISEGGAGPETTQAYLRRRQCVMGLSPVLPVQLPDGAQQKFSMDRVTTEEDMADWVMHKCVPFDEHPSTCDFLKVTKDGHYDPNFLDIVPAADDTHSGSLMRMMREWHAKHSSLPGSCQQIANAHTGIVEVRTCE